MRSRPFLAGTLLTLLLAAPAPAAEPEAAAPRTVAVRTPAAAPELAEAVRRGWFFTSLPPPEGVEVDVGPAAAGEPLIAVLAWPPPAAEMAALERLPVAAGEGAIRLAGDAYPAAGVTAAFRLPDEARTAGGARWWVLGADREAVAEMANQVLIWELWPGSRAEADYFLQEEPWMQRAGNWRRGGDRWEVDPARDRDDFAERRRWLAALVPVAGERLRLLAPPADAGRPELVRLAAELERALAAMAPRVPSPLPTPEEPLRVAVEESHTAQLRHAGALGEAVPGRSPDSGLDLHLVFHPDDLYAYRVALAGVLMERSGRLAGVPPWLRRGAALWLAGEWFGRAWRDWLPDLAVAGTLPAAAELLAAEEQADASASLWTPWAAAVVDRLPGDTLAAKLARPPDAGRTAALLAAAEAQARAAGARAAGNGTGAPPWVVPTPGFLRGVSLAMHPHPDLAYHAPLVGGALDRLAGLGADAVSLMPFAFQRRPKAPEMRFLNRSPGSETDVGMVHAARRARAHGFRVLWKPHLWIGSGSWPGDVAMESEADWAAWWRVYRRYVLHHAFLAAWTGSELFSVGVELGGTTHREADWRRLIADVRRIYPGMVTYAANWYGDEVGFWDALDLAGVDAYFPLAENTGATPDELAAGARRVVAQLAERARQAGRPLLLTEVGFPARRGAWRSPHEEGGELSEADQAAAYRALLGALGHPRWLAGAFFWKIFLDDDGRAVGEPDFRILGRPAEAEVRRWLAAGGRGEGR